MAKYVAVKVGTADSCSEEVERLSRVSASSNGNRDFGGNRILGCWIASTLTGPRGHTRASSRQRQDAAFADAAQAAGDGPVQVHVARSIAQLVMAVAYIHQLRCGHGGPSDPCTALV